MEKTKLFIELTIVKHLDFAGIDSWNCPIFCDKAKRNYYGSTDKLFDYGTGKREVLKSVGVEDLLYFGCKFDCEPYGSMPKFELVINQG